MIQSLKKKLLSIPLIKRFYKKYRVWKKRQEYVGLDNEQIFTRIYQTNKWDTFNVKDSTYYSGTGSYGESAEKYVSFLTGFIKKNNISSVTDIGCGDFSIGKQVVSKVEHLNYNGCDVVKDVIDANAKAYATDRVKFVHMDAVTDDLPPAQLLTIRQVLQHLSNNDIKKILSKVKAFKYVIVTEHLLKEGTESKPNKDKPSGPDIRLVDNSGVYINKPPFNLDCAEVLSIREDAYGKEAYIKSFLIVN